MCSTALFGKCPRYEHSRALCAPPTHTRTLAHTQKMLEHVAPRSKAEMAENMQLRREIGVHVRLRHEYEAALHDTERENARLKALRPPSAPASSAAHTAASTATASSVSTSALIPPLGALTLGAGKSALMTVRLPSRLATSLPPPSPNQALRRPAPPRSGGPQTLGPSLPPAPHSVEHLV
jgi:hypothetical protein